MRLAFSSDDVLATALSLGIVEPKTALEPARVGWDSSGRRLIEPANPMPETEAERLRAFGVVSDREFTAAPKTIAHWLQAVPLRRAASVPKLGDATPVLFEIADASALADIVREILRLGNDRQTVVRYGGEHGAALLKVLGPPYYTILRALDRRASETIRAYLESTPGLWVEFGYTHPLLAQVRPPTGQIVLIGAPDRWVNFSAAPFRDIYDCLTIAPAQVVRTCPTAASPEVCPRLRLVAGNTTARPELWQLEIGDEHRLDALAASANSQLSDGLAFAVGCDSKGNRGFLLRARPRRSTPLALDWPTARSYRLHRRVPNLFVPTGTQLSPPLSRDTLRSLLTSDLTSVVWLKPIGDGEFIPQSLREDAFRPLTDWPEYVIQRQHSSLAEWAAASRCEFGLKPAEPTERDAPDPTAPREPIPRPAPAQPAPPAPPPAIPRPPLEARPPSEAAVPRPTDPLQDQLRRLEERFLTLSGPLDSLERRALWPKLGRLNAALDHRSEAALCWLNALWYRDGPDANLAWQWVQSERALAGKELTPSELEALLAAKEPTAADLRRTAAALIWTISQPHSSRTLESQLSRIQEYLVRHDGLLPVRAVWLTWYGLTQRVRPDPLALARVRDRLLGRLLADGLSAERDLPAFLRFAGHQGGARLRALRAQFERIRQAIRDWIRGDLPPVPSTAIQNLQQSSAYVDLFFAFGSARLGEAAAARALVSAAEEEIDAAGSDAHRFLLEAFRWRVEQVLAGQPHAGSLPKEQLEYLDHLRREVSATAADNPIRAMAPYVIDRMRKESRILEPQEELDPYRHTRREHDTLVRDLARLADVHDERTLSDGLRRLMSQANSRRLVEVRLRVLAEALPLAARVGAALAGELLQQVESTIELTPESADPITQERRAVLLERALFFAVHFDRADLVPRLVARLEALLGETTAPTVLEARSRLIGQSLRSLRKCGLLDETARLLDRLAAAVGDSRRGRDGAGDWEAARTRLHLAGGWLAADQPERARPILDAASELILTGRPAAPDRPAALYVSLIVNYVQALAHGPLDDALERVLELFTSRRLEKLPNSFTTAPYYSRFHLAITEAVVLSLATEEFAMGPAARRWLDDDEYAVRRRIHSDVRAALGREGR